MLTLLGVVLFVMQNGYIQGPSRLKWLYLRLQNSLVGLYPSKKLSYSAEGELFQCGYQGEPPRP